uniref:Uncharacterized protein n=1 Tax=Leptocylindrus danicus TaxID=163516 RepID=A0A7S2P922_9STRA
MTIKAQPANANLMQFPCKNGLGNTYHFMRAGESLLEEQNILMTNPLFLTNREAALSERGIEQVLDACRLMEENDVNPSIVTYSIAAKSCDTASIISRELMIGNNRMMPEYTNLDPRGAGKWDGLELDSTEAAIIALDSLEAGNMGKGGRTPEHDDGTPNETLFNQVTRLTQLMSMLETYYSGDTILLIFPDGTGPALLSSLIAGIPLNRVHELQFSPGEIRMDITYESVISSMQRYASNYDEGYGMAELQALQQKEKMQTKTETAIPRSAKEQISSTPADTHSTKNNLPSAGVVKKSATTKRIANPPVKTPVEAKKYRDTREIMAMGFFALFGVGGASMVGLDSKKREPILEENLKIWARDDTKAKPHTKVKFHKPMPLHTNDIEKPVDLKAPELVDMEKKIVDAPFKVPEMEEYNNYNFDQKRDLRKEMTEKAAHEAMEQYLNQDDGADAWLDAITFLANEEEAKDQII